MTPSTIVETMKNAVIHNYIAPGLDSFLLNKNDCKVRLFEMTRNQEFYICPHNHRFDFACCVLRGYVKHYVYQMVNQTWYYDFVEAKQHAVNRTNNLDNLYRISEYIPKAKVPGQSDEFYLKRSGFGFFNRTETLYGQYEWYCLEKNQYHAIEFSQGAQVLFLEGANQRDTSTFLEPVINGKTIPIFTVPEWMYKP